MGYTEAALHAGDEECSHVHGRSHVKPGGRIRLALALLAITATAGVATACTSGTAEAPEPAPESGSTPTSPSPTPTGESAADPRSLDVDGDADDNLGYFNSVNEQVIDADPEAGGQDFVAALAQAGFDRSGMQVTADRTTIDLPADSVQFSVHWKDRCLIGQYGTGSDGYRSTVVDPLASGACLVGATVPVGGPVD